MPKVLQALTGLPSVEGFLDMAVASVEAALACGSVLSIELSVDAILCLEGVRCRKLEGRDGSVTARLEVVEATFTDELGPVQKRPKNREAAA